VKIAIVVHGRFHAFDLARVFLQRGHQVFLLTNYPAWAVARFGVPKDVCRVFWLHGVLQRIADRLPRKWREATEPALHRMFGRWAALRLSKVQKPDLIHCWSGVAEEILRSFQNQATETMVIRESAHIKTQASILREEERRLGICIDQPTPWMIQREQREYALAKTIRITSQFVYRSFVQEGIASDKLRLIPPALPVGLFHPSPEVLRLRCSRILSGQPLRVLYVGTLSFRKGFHDLTAIIQALGNKRFVFQLVGPALPEVRAELELLSGLAEWIPKRPQAELIGYYSGADLFIFPTLEDGHAYTLSQAMANALPVLTTPHCQGPDLIQENKTGWILPIRTPEAFVARLRWCDGHRDQLAPMVRSTAQDHAFRSWDDVAIDLEKIVTKTRQDFRSPETELK
jgi:glycosyltransferase involved in cell wall biosynthesis